MKSPREKARVRTHSRVALPPNLERVNAAAKDPAQTRLPALLHDIDEDALLRALRRQKRQASAGGDGVTVAKYEEGLTDNIRDVCRRVHTGRYRPQPVRRVHIPKADGGKRPLGSSRCAGARGQDCPKRGGRGVERHLRGRLPGFSHGFRPGRNPQMALDCPAYGDHEPARELGARCRTRSQSKMSLSACLVGVTSARIGRRTVVASISNEVGEVLRRAIYLRFAESSPSRRWRRTTSSKHPRESISKHPDALRGTPARLAKLEALCYAIIRPAEGTSI
ncbi:hypothetical protein ABIC09_007531 [Bradyrhizobium sp. S3.12.5]